MEIGKAYLVHCGDWHTFVGRVVSQQSAYVYTMYMVSKVVDTHGGDNWEELAMGDKKARKAAEYRHYGRAVIPLTVVAFEWEGALPQEDE